jgi:prepilin signal peptidase PulO-like enzyme (type II secretory pathway)
VIRHHFDVELALGGRVAKVWSYFSKIAVALGLGVLASLITATALHPYVHMLEPLLLSPSEKVLSVLIGLLVFLLAARNLFSGVSIREQVEDFLKPGPDDDFN